MKLYRTRTDNAVTYRIECDTLSGPCTGTLSGNPIIETALVDGLLWWAFGRRLEAFVATAVEHVDEGLEAVLYTGDRLVRFVHTTPWQETSAEATKRITATIASTLPALASLIEQGPDHDQRRREFVSLTALAHALRRGEVQAEVIDEQPQQLRA